MAHSPDDREHAADLHGRAQHEIEALLAEAKGRGRRLRQRRRAAVGAVLLLGILAAVLVARSPAGTRVNVVGPPAPTSTLPPTPGPSGTAPACRAGNLQARGSWQGAQGSMAGGILFVNHGQRPCSVGGRPAVELDDQHGKRLGVVVVEPATPSPVAPVVLAPGGNPASVLVQWSNWCGADPGPVVATATLPSGAGSLAVAPPIGLIPRCNNPASPSTLDVGNFTQG